MTLHLPYENQCLGPVRDGVLTNYLEVFSEATN